LHALPQYIIVVNNSYCCHGIKVCLYFCIAIPRLGENYFNG
jgi:hypothetical protein